MINEGATSAEQLLLGAFCAYFVKAFLGNARHLRHERQQAWRRMRRRKMTRLRLTAFLAAATLPRCWYTGVCKPCALARRAGWQVASCYLCAARASEAGGRLLLLRAAGGARAAARAARAHGGRSWRRSAYPRRRRAPASAARGRRRRRRGGASALLRRGTYRM